ncbi:MAG: hypothetical protein KBH48_00700, partial [Mediterraneibacter sp.]|nr:hypothetical protein [Mediterraneibacter sp.]
MEKQDTSVFPVYNEPEVRDSSEVWLIVYRSSGNFGEIFVFTNWNLYNYLSNFPHFIGFPACPLV